jgi:hypothetical protein
LKLNSPSNETSTNINPDWPEQKSLSKKGPSKISIHSLTDSLEQLKISIDNTIANTFFISNHFFKDN